MGVGKKKCKKSDFFNETSIQLLEMDEEIENAPLGDAFIMIDYLEQLLLLAGKMTLLPLASMPSISLRMGLMTDIIIADSSEVSSGWLESQWYFFFLQTLLRSKTTAFGRSLRICS